jgi:hypothetical protein
MTKAEMQLYWQANYQLCPPINYLFKIFFPDKWLRIHSLTSSKRYADTIEEWEILLHTQNQILDDIFNDGDILYLFTGLYSSGSLNIIDKPDLDNVNLSKFNFTAFETIDLHAITKEYFDEDVYYTPHFALDHYKSSTYNEILKSIADDELRVFFLNPITTTIFAPYDGGVDIIYADVKARDFAKKKYSHFVQFQS